MPNVQRSRDFYRKHLGMKVLREDGRNSCFLGCGNDFVALFRSDKAGMHHYCYTVPKYDPDDVVRRLKAAELQPRRQSNRVYFDDPDGLTVQLAGEDHAP